MTMVVEYFSPGRTGSQPMYATRRDDYPPDALWSQLTHPSERQRLQRFCLRLAGGNSDVAEDMTQETLTEAWRRRDALRNAEASRAYLYGIAQNVSRRWWRQKARENAYHVASPAPHHEGGESFLESLPDPNLQPPDLGLEQAEIAALLDRAMHRLTPTTRAVLIAHYVDETPHAEIAARHGLTEQSAAVRVHRAKQALREALTEGKLRAEAVAHGLISEEVEGWVETRIWCPMCGGRQMHARRSDAGVQTIACPGCHYSLGPNPSADYFSACFFKHHAFRAEQVVQGVTAFKPALNRLHSWWFAYLREGLKRGSVRCLACGQPTELSSSAPASPQYAYPTRNWLGVHSHCLRCGHVHVLPPNGFAVSAPAVTAFWKKHPRIRQMPARRIPGHPRSAWVARYESVTDSTRLEVVFAGDDFEVLETSGSGGDS